MKKSIIAAVFPAPAGINRRFFPTVCHRDGVPRASGDKPLRDKRHTQEEMCSPRQRG
ncbi:hypothetical protein G6410_002096 [Salmonella enterica]|nr:hypothetical protein [Salmonella enterica]